MLDVNLIAKGALIDANRLTLFPALQIMNLADQLAGGIAQYAPVAHIAQRPAGRQLRLPRADWPVAQHNIGQHLAGWRQVGQRHHLLGMNPLLIVSDAE